MSSPAFSPVTARPTAPAAKSRPAALGSGAAAGVPRFLGATPVPSEATPKNQRASAAGPNPAAMSSEVVDLSTGTFTPSEKVKAEIEAQDRQGLDVRVIVKGLTTEGRVKVRADRGQQYDSVGRGSMPLLNAWTEQIGGMHLNFTLKNNEVKDGYASLKPRGGDTNDWMQAVKKNAALLGGVGLKVGELPTVVNKFEQGQLTLGVTKLKVEVGGYVDAEFNLLLENAQTPKIEATANVKVRGLEEGHLKLDNTQGALAGEISLAIKFKSFSGSAQVKYDADGTVDIRGKGAYNANKLSGEVEFVATDVESANSFARSAITAAGGKENVQTAGPPAPVPAPKSGKKPRGIAAAGQLAFNLTNWFAGTVHVVVDGKGDITVIGKIAPPAEIELFKQRDWDKELIKFEAKAYYGIPVVGNLNLFANISLHALAKLGPAKIYQIEILGTYSTDPEIQKSIQISGSINISAYAGLRLRAEGGAGIEILDHDLKFGIGLNADIGVKAYADARPTIGYREPGEFYISGTLEMVAQPMLGLSGDFFIELETPWWSPLSDDKWIWPLFSKEWPLTDPIGLSATVKEYVLGSRTVPEIEMKKPEFDPSKFMTNMVDRTLPDKSGGHDGGQGTFKEDGSVPKPVVPPKKAPPTKAPPKSGKKGASPKAGKSGVPDPKGAKEKDVAKILKGAADQVKALASQRPLASDELNSEMVRIKGKAKGVEFDVVAKGAQWLVTPKVGGKPGKRGITLPAKPLKVNEGKANAATPDRDAIDWHAREVASTHDGEQHAVYLEGEPGSLKLKVSSSPMDVDVAVKLIEKSGLSAADKKTALARANEQKQIIVATVKELTKLNAGTKATAGNKAKDDPEISTLNRTLRAAMRELVKILAEAAFDGGGYDDLDSTELKFTGGSKAAVAKADPLTSKRGDGSPPSVNPVGWSSIVDQRLTENAPYYVRLHLINENFAGPGDDVRNLVPGSKQNNSDHLHSAEKLLKDLVGVDPKEKQTAQIWYWATVKYYSAIGRDKDWSADVKKAKVKPSDFAESIRFTWGLYKWKGKKAKWEKNATPVGNFKLGPIPLPDL